MAWEICEDSIAKGDLTTNSTNHLAVATMNEYFKTFSRENRLKIRFDFIITRISAEEAKAQGVICYGNCIGCVGVSVI